jgi:hypothetical protein
MYDDCNWRSCSGSVARARVAFVAMIARRWLQNSGIYPEMQWGWY